MERTQKTEGIVVSIPIEGETHSSIMKSVIVGVGLKEIVVCSIGETRRTTERGNPHCSEGQVVADKQASILRVTIGNEDRVGRPS